MYLGCVGITVYITQCGERGCHNHATAREHSDAHVAHFPLILIIVLCCECDDEICVVPGVPDCIRRKTGPWQ